LRKEYKPKIKNQESGKILFPTNLIFPDSSFFFDKSMNLWYDIRYSIKKHCGILGREDL